MKHFENYLYDPAKVRVMVNGMDIVGFGDDDKIKIAPVTKEQYKSFAGVDGEVAFTKVNDKRHAITFSLKGGSPSNVALDALSKLPTTFSVTVTNKSSGGYVGTSIGCRIMERPEINFTKENRKCEWMILAPYWAGQQTL